MRNARVFLRRIFKVKNLPRTTSFLRMRSTQGCSEAVACVMDRRKITMTLTIARDFNRGHREICPAPIALPLSDYEAARQSSLTSQISFNPISRLIFYYLAVLLVLTFFGPAANAQTIIPENAHKLSFSDRWECDIGYERKRELCVKIIIPDNAYPTHKAYGRGWECHWSFSQSKDQCRPVFVPENGYLNSTGSSWRCDRGYTKQKDSCKKIVALKNGFLNERGDQWQCEPGFQIINQACAAIIPPQNGYLTMRSYDKGWACRHGYYENENKCTKIDLPENAFLTRGAFAEGWKCERGYSRKQNSCQWIDIPENAHLGYSGNTWDCVRPYNKIGNQCVSTKP